MSSTPSIGSIGLSVDRVNSRVKVLLPDVCRRATEAKYRLMDVLAHHPLARELLSRQDARFTGRVLGVDIPTIEAFTLTRGLVVSEEARIRTASGVDIIYIGGNRPGRWDIPQLQAECRLAHQSLSVRELIERPRKAVFEELKSPSPRDVADLVEMYKLCFTSYLVPLDEALVENAATNAIFFVARDGSGRIVASAIGESLRLGPLTLLEISEVAAHPERRVRGAALECVRQVAKRGKDLLPEPVVTFWEARMWRNILGMGPLAGLTQLAGILHQHCRIASPPELTTLSNPGEFGSLAVYYAPE